MVEGGTPEGEPGTELHVRGNSCIVRYFLPFYALPPRLGSARLDY